MPSAGGLSLAAAFFDALYVHDNSMTNNELTALLEQKAYTRLSEALYETNEVDIAELLEELAPNEAVVVFRVLKKDQASDVFAELDSETQQHIISSITNSEIEELIEDLYVDDAVDMLSEMPADIVKRVMKNARPDTRAIINRYLNYAPDSAGSIMTDEFVELTKAMTAKQAIHSIRSSGTDKEMVYTCYVTDDEHYLLGVVSFRDILFSDPSTPIDDLMNRDVMSVKTGDDREEVAGKISRYGFLALPVVDGDNRLVGIVTVDDAVDVMRKETTEDFHKMAAVTPSEKPYLETSTLVLAKNRALWLLVLMLAGTATGLVLRRFELAIASVPLLVTFVPMLMGTSGNAGSQTSTMVIRGMAVGEIETSDWAKVLGKETLVALICGGVLAAVNGIRILIYPGSLPIAISVSASLLAAILIGKISGAMLPLLAKKIGVDPAVMAAPILTTIVDVTSMLIYFAVSVMLLGI